MNVVRKAAQFLILLLSMYLPSNFIYADNPKICLTMIVRNEEKIIERCLDSVKDTIDCLSICDTGSDDNTIQIIEQYMQKNKIPGKVYKQEWKNFGHNRTLSAQAAQKTIYNLGFPLNNTYLLLIDADMMLVSEPAFNKESLHDDGYLVLQKTPDCAHYNMRLLRASLPWHSVGVTHEYWSCMSPDVKENKIDTLWINDRDDGGCKSDKFERDIKMLTQGLQDEPENVRYMFYLAQSYKSLNKYEDAISRYKARIAMGGWIEEVWYSKFMIGQCYEDMGKWDEALLSYLDAYQYNPARAEPLQQISTYYRFKEQYNLSYLFAKQGLAIPYPKNDILFISHPVYSYLFDQDLSIAAFYTPYKEEGYAINNRLMLKKDIPWHIKQQAYKNAVAYVPNLTGAQYKPIKIDLPLIREGLAGHYNPMNPSIMKTEKGYDLICRTVNYIQIGARHFKSLDLFDSSNTARTRNFLIQYDKDFKLLTQQEIIENVPREKIKYCCIDGLEDCRLFSMNGSTWFTCTTVDTNPARQHQISLCKLADNRTGPIVQVEKLIPLNGPDLTRCEKNWLPFMKDNEFHMIYSYDPLVIYKPVIDSKAGIIKNHIFLDYGKSNKHDLSRFSGSAAPIEFDNGYLLIVHEAVDDDQRTYLHRFLTLDKDFKIKQVSKPFIFLHKGIEYACSMTIDHSGKNLVIPIGIEDREAYLCTVSLETVRSLLEPLP